MRIYQAERFVRGRWVKSSMAFTSKRAVEKWIGKRDGWRVSQPIVCGPSAGRLIVGL